ncbi:MAG: hypothetical protein ACD_3C00037G0029 [uncultured bacterium (gcode 4)]|uniref:Uncharacterized protein n=1 Tax=uncultured bacterium (gcode 4) TaxID=1234023 RepID=K2G0D0_9BACT|nr:MAG: hypothetical protein ACD_3C00037G0029 [uncultured bacterium (gcode 4)]
MNTIKQENWLEDIKWNFTVIINEYSDFLQEKVSLEIGGSLERHLQFAIKQQKLIDYIYNHWKYKFELLWILYETLRILELSPQDSYLDIPFNNGALMVNIFKEFAEFEKIIPLSHEVSNSIKTVKSQVGDAIESWLEINEEARILWRIKAQKEKHVSLGNAKFLHEELLAMAKDKEKSWEKCFKAKIITIGNSAIEFTHYPQFVKDALIWINIVWSPVWGSRDNFYFWWMHTDYFIKLLMDASQFDAAKWINKNIKTRCIWINVNDCEFLELIDWENIDSMYELSDSDTQILTTIW